MIKLFPGTSIQEACRFGDSREQILTSTVDTLSRRILYDILLGMSQRTVGLSRKYSQKHNQWRRGEG
jgi:hypothetical protein